MKRKYIKLNDNYSHLSIGNIINAIKDESKNKSSAIQSEVFCALFNLDYINESTVNNYCIGSRSIGNDYKQIYINLKKKYKKDENSFVNIICNILTIINGSIYDLKNIESINTNSNLKNVCTKLYNVSKNDLYVPKENITKFRKLLKLEKYYHLFSELLLYAILDKKQPLYENEQTQNMVETILQNTDISVIDLQNFLILELNEGINFSHSLRNLANDGNAYANYRLAVMEYRGEFSGCPRYDKAYEYFIASANNNHPSACWMIGNMIIKGKIGSKKHTDFKEAIKYFEKAKSLGNVAAINSLGLCYKKGLGVNKNLDKALKLFKEAANKNYVYALNNLGIYYESQNDYNNAYKFFIKSANLNESYACNKIGEYKRKENKKQEALEYYKKALESSTTEKTIWAYYNIAKYYYLDGDLETHTLKDIEKAIEYFEHSNTLIESLEELLYIYYEKYLNNKTNEILNKINHYKTRIENHPQYNDKIKKSIESKLEKLKQKNLIKIPF
ncbi:MAG: SEL1-like repeat protein [Firmicutes bacterium]|nr:SEL1-like repeat protein [Bacillota bacterium]